MSARNEDASLGKRKVPKALKAQAGDIGAADKWWEKEDNNEGKEPGTNWNYLEHHGVQFPAEYPAKGLTITYDGTPVLLTPFQEEMAYYWCQSVGTEWETKEEYRNNFIRQFSALFKDRKYTKLDLFDFTTVIELIQQRKEERAAELAQRKTWTTEQKMKLKKEKEDKDAIYGYAIVDNTREKVGGYTIEPPTLFKGRGVHPKSGIFKPRTYPEDITINVSEDAPVPKCTMPGHAWKHIDHNKGVTWLAFYKDEAINNSFKYFFLSANSRLKGQNDMKKYEKARKLKAQISKIRGDYMSKIKSNDMYQRQIGTVAYFIDKLALRVGNEKNDEEEADTVGCCSLRKEHVELMPDNQVKFDFLGKDSMRYENTVSVDPHVYNNLKDFMKGKKEEEDLFDSINPSKLNEYFSGLMENLTAKVFRTFNASSTLDQELNATNLDQALSVEDKYKFYNDANKKVAILCNHQKTVNKDFDQRLEKQQKRVDEMEEYLGELKEHLKLLKKGKRGYENKDEIDENSVAKIKKRFPVTSDSTTEAISKMESKVHKEKLKLDERIETKNVSLGTSKINYNDPRISVSWCKRNSVPIERIFSKELRSKFTWAMVIEPTWRF